nr:ABC transporter permease subunit [Candidatus Sigynarchaeota archaeon]
MEKSYSPKETSKLGRLRLLLKISKKDWKEIRTNKQILVPMIILPIMFTVFFPIVGIILPLMSMTPADLAEFALLFPEYAAQPVLGYLHFYVSTMLRPFFVMIPLMLTSVIAADSWAGEKERKTAESLLLLPLSDTELLVAKVLASLIPGLVITWVCGAVVSVILDIAAFPYLGYLFLPDASWIYLIFVFAPVMAFFAIFTGVYVSYRAKDTKSAQQISGSVVIIFLGVLVSGFLGVADIVLYMLTIGFGAIDLILVYFSPKIFSRENMIAKF